MIFLELERAILELFTDLTIKTNIYFGDREKK